MYAQNFPEVGWNARSSQKGMGLLEIMVAMAIGIVGVLTIMQSYSTSQKIKASTTGLADLQNTARFAINTLGRQISVAGQSLAEPGVIGCNAVINYGGSSGLQRVRLIGVEIAPGGSSTVPNGNAGSDSIAVSYGSAVSVASASGTGSAVDLNALPNGQVTLENRAGFVEGDWVVISTGRPKALAGDVRNCQIVEVNGLPAATGNPPEALGVCSGSSLAASSGYALQIDGSAYKRRRSDNTCTATPGPMKINNFTSGITFGEPVYYDLGANPVFALYAVRNNNLDVCVRHTPFTNVDPTCADAASWKTVANNVVHLKAQYGVDSSGGSDMNNAGVDLFTKDVPASSSSRETALSASNYATVAPANIVKGIVTAYSSTPNYADWDRIRSIRLAMVTRSQAAENTDVSPATIKLWADSAVAPVTTGPEYTVPNRKYKYYPLDAIVPLKNVIWRPQDGGDIK